MEVRPGYKQTDVGVVPDDWRVASLGELALKVGSGITPTGGHRVYRDHGRPFVRSQNVGWGSLLLDDVAFIDESTHSTFPDTEIHTDDVLLNITGASIGRSALADARLVGGNVNQHVCIIRSNPRELVPDFLNLFLLSVSGQHQIDSFQAGGNRQGLNFGQVRSMRIPLPPTESEQRAIAAALSDVDALLGGLDRLIAKKRDLKQAAMHQLLTGDTRLPGFHEAWEVTRLGDLCEIGMGRTPSRFDQSMWGPGFPWLSIADLKSKVVCESREQISARAAALMPIIPKGTLLMSFKLSIGRLCFAGCDLFTNEAICSLNGLSASADFLYYSLGMTDFSLYGKQAVKGFTLNKESLNAVEVNLPSRDEQVAIAAVLSDIDTELCALEARRDKTRALKQAMMQELLTGRTRLVPAGGTDA